MKKLIFSLSLGAMFLISCNKEEIKTNVEANQTEFTKKGVSGNYDYRNITVENGVLSFPSIEYYESIANDENYAEIEGLISYINEINFPSYGRVNPESTIFEDEFMETILNANQIVKIGEWLIRINPDREEAFAVSSLVENAIEIIMREDNTPGLYKFNTTENVLDYLNNPEELENRNGICGESGTADRNSIGYYSPYTPLYSDLNRKILEHRKFGIYFKLQTRCFHPGSVAHNHFFWIQYSFRTYKKTCQPIVNNGAGYVWLGGNGAATDVITHGTRNFNKYHIRIEAGGRGTINALGEWVYEAALTHFLEIRANM